MPTSVIEASRVKLVSDDGTTHYLQLVATPGGHADLNLLDADGVAVATPFSSGVSNSGGRVTGRLNDIGGAGAHAAVDPETGHIVWG